MAYTGWSPRIFLEQILDVRAVDASALVKHPKACLIHFRLPLFIISSGVIPALVINCRSQRADVFLFNKAARTGTTAKITSSGKKNSSRIKN